MRTHAKVAWLFLFVCMAATSFAAAQEKREGSNGDHQVVRKSPPGAQQKLVRTRLLTQGDGLAILGAALDSRRRTASHPDCSHFVQGLYSQAGFPYEYASSSELYVGVGEFQRVTSPQPGDLAVWRGHVGIVVSPLQHSFFSLLRSGPGVDSYDAPYWKQRGRPRFFRYVKTAPSGAPPSPVRNASWKPPVSDHAEELSGNDPAPDESEDLGGETSSSMNPATLQPEKPSAPPTVILTAVRPRPDQVSEAFLQTCKIWEQSLRGRDLFKSTQSLIVFDHFEVRKVHITGNHGWAEIQIDEPVSLVSSKAQLHKRSEHQRWSLTRRDSKTWELAPAPNTIYLPQPAAVRLLANELAQLTADTPDAASNTQQKALLARLLGVLLEK